MFHALFFRPLFNALVALYNTVAFEDLGLAIIFLTILIRVILYPLFYKSFKNQLLMQRIQPHVKKIQSDHREDRKKQAEAMMALYREHKINPFSGVFLLLIQLPVLIALYQVFLKGIGVGALADLYPFVHAPERLASTLFGLINLEKPHMLVVGIAVIAQYFQGKVGLRRPHAHAEGVVAKGEREQAMERMGKHMVFMGPLLTLLFLPALPSAVGLYWSVTSLFSIGQQLLIIRALNRHGTSHPVSNTSQNPH